MVRTIQGSKIKKRYNDLLTVKQVEKSQKNKMPKTRKAAWALFSITSAVIIVPDAYYRIYNALKKNDTTEIKQPTISDLLPELNNEEIQQIKEEEIKQEKENKEFALNFLKEYIAKQVKNKIDANFSENFDIMAVFELNHCNDNIENVKMSTLNILIKDENNQTKNIIFNNANAKLEIENSGTKSDIISSLIAHLQQSSISNLEAIDEERENILYICEDNAIFIGQTQTYVEGGNTGSSLEISVYFKQNEKYVCKRYKNLKTEFEKLEVSPEYALALNFAGIDNECIKEFSNSKDNNFEALNKIFYDILNPNQTEEKGNNDLLPEDEFANIVNEQILNSVDNYIDEHSF